MSVIPQSYNQGTGFIGSANSGGGGELPDAVDDLIVNNTLTVLGPATFEDTVNINSDLNVTGETTLNDLNVTGTIQFQDVQTTNATVLNKLDVGVEVEVQGTIGAPGATNQFALPTNGPPTTGDVIKFTSPNTTEFAPENQPQDDFVSFNTINEAFVDNKPGQPPTQIDSATFTNVTTTNVGRAGVEFELPAAAPATGQLLTALNPNQTEWSDPVPEVTDYLTVNTQAGVNNVELVINNQPAVPVDNLVIQPANPPGFLGGVSLGTAPGAPNNTVFDATGLYGTALTQIKIDSTGVVMSVGGFITQNDNLFLIKNNGDVVIGAGQQYTKWPATAPIVGQSLTRIAGGNGTLASPFNLGWQ